MSVKTATEKMTVLNYFITVDLDRRNKDNKPLVRFSPTYNFDLEHYDAVKFYYSIIENGVEIPVGCHVLARKTIGAKNVELEGPERFDDSTDYFISKGLPPNPDWNDLTCVTLDLLNNKREKAIP